jgi:hypothetical protein
MLCLLSFVSQPGLEIGDAAQACARVQCLLKRRYHSTDRAFGQMRRDP